VNSSGEYFYNPLAANRVCPPNWHLPSVDDWTVLTDYVGIHYPCNNDNTNIAKALASETGWECCWEECTPSNQNQYANNASHFSAIPAGEWYQGSFYGESDDATFWTSTESNPGSAFYWVRQIMAWESYVYGEYAAGSDQAYSVRCVYDEEVEEPEQSFRCGDVIEDVDHNEYNTVQIGEQCWMKENLRTEVTPDGTPIASSDMFVPGNNSNNISTYGYLYTWDAMMNGETASATTSNGVQGICPDGWHIPSHEEFDTMRDFASTLDEECGAGRSLAAQTGWALPYIYSDCGFTSNPNENNASGFTALPAGYYSTTNYGYSNTAQFWMTDETSAENGLTFKLTAEYGGYGFFQTPKSYGNSVRCVMNADGGNTTETCPSLGESQEAHSTSAQYVYSPVIDFDASKINNDLCGYAVYAGGLNVLVVRKRDYTHLVNTDFIEDNGSYNLWMTIDFDLIVTAAQEHGVQVASGDYITITPILNLFGCEESMNSSVFLTMP
jgi:uncharacterized protein (TIGR02145 family)